MKQKITCLSDMWNRRIEAERLKTSELDEFIAILKTTICRYNELQRQKYKPMKASEAKAKADKHNNKHRDETGYFSLNELLKEIDINSRWGNYGIAISARCFDPSHKFDLHNLGYKVVDKVDGDNVIIHWQ